VLPLCYPQKKPTFVSRLIPLCRREDLNLRTLLHRILVCSLGIFSLSHLGDFGYYVHARQNEKFELYQTLMETNQEKYQEYIFKNPNVEDDFKQWLEEKK